jgi:LacI family transcriptional regulator
MAKISEIAELAHVSRGTVDRVIHGRRGVADENRRKVLKVLKVLNYRPNMYARGLSLSKTFRFGVLIPDTSNNVGYWDLPYAGILRAGQELSPYKVTIMPFRYSNGAEDSYSQACAELLNNLDTLDGLVIAPVLRAATEALLEKFNTRIPVVLIESKLPGFGNLSYIGSDPLQGGYLAGRLFERLSEGQQQRIAIIREIPENYNINNRVQGFASYLKNHPLISTEILDADRRKNKYIFPRLALELLSRVVKPNGIFVPSACVSEVAEIVKAEGLQGKIRLIGFDPTKENISGLKDGVIDILISQRSDVMGYKGIYALFNHVVLKEEIPKEILTPLDILIKENIDSYCNSF